MAWLITSMVTSGGIIMGLILLSEGIFFNDWGKSVRRYFILAGIQLLLSNLYLMGVMWAR